MTELAARARSRIQGNMDDWRGNRSWKNDLRQQQSDIRRSRMTCSASLPAFHQTQDWTGGMGMSPSGRFKVVESQPARQKLISSDGIQWKAAVLALILIGTVLFGFLAADLAGIGTSSRAIVKLDGKIESVTEKNETLRQEIALGTGTSSICTEAVKMDLISSNGARTIRLTAPAEAQLLLSSATAAEENKDLEVRMTSFAGD